MEQPPGHRLPQSEQDRLQSGDRRQYQTMVFGNMGEDSGNVAFSRNPSTGERKLYGEYLINAQGEDVVAGVHSRPIAELGEDMPEIFEQFRSIAEA